jgi:general secretion pathway protein C
LATAREGARQRGARGTSRARKGAENGARAAGTRVAEENVRAEARMQKVIFWSALMGLVGTAAYLDARAITALVGTAVAAPSRMLAQSPQVIVLAPREERPSAGSILARNPFDASARDVREAPAVDPEPRDARHAKPCEGFAVHLIAFADDPEWSFASLSDARESRSTVRRRGDAMGAQSVAFIGRDRVWLTRDGALCQVELFAPPPAALPPAPDRVPAKASITPGANAPAIAGIARQGDRDYAIDRAVLDRILDDPAKLMTLAQTIPVKVDGRMIGVRLKGVRPDSLLGAIGLVDGDQLEKVNGFDLTSPERILEAYARLREATHLTMQITRGGAPLNIDYSIR